MARTRTGTPGKQHTVPKPALPARLRLAITRLARRLRQQGETTASPTQLAVLATVERDGPITLGTLAAVERVQPPTITAAVGRLEQRGLVQRLTDPDDRRVARVEITPEGRRLLEQSRSRKTAYLERRLATLTADERITLERAAGILERLLEEDAGDAAAPRSRP
ncbi:MAG TPA: MarR family transcriptional regulator [Acidimicrobiia bacterium]|jgi:DNA-binding MarR family transcriptional regulator|nr:MarR family transcriptional regulator [Acidimicrobiia bacterium]